MRAEQQHREQHQPDAGLRIARLGEHQAAGADRHDADLGGLHDADDPRLVMAVGELARQGGKQEEGQDGDAGRQRVEIRFLAGSLNTA